MSKNKRGANRRQNGTILSVLSSDETPSENNQSVDDSSSKSTTINQNTNPLAVLKKHWWAVGIIAFLSLGVFGAGLKYLEDSAKREQAANAGKSNFEKAEPSLLSKVNPYALNPTPAPTPQLSKEYLYAGSRMLAVEDANANAAPPADLAVWRPGNGYWYVLGGVVGSQQTFSQFGASSDEPVPGDYDGDGKTDFAVRRKSSPSGGGSATWYISYSSSGAFTGIVFGFDDDLVAPADYDGDGKTDLAVFRAATGHWYIQGSSAGLSQIHYGQAGDIPAPGDYDGDGRADAAFWRPNGYSISWKRSSDGQGQFQSFVMGAVPTDQPVSADYDGDGKADPAMRHGVNWLIRYSASSYTGATDFTTVTWQAGTHAVQNDYDGDGKVDIAVWRSGDGHWLIRQSGSLAQNNGLRDVQWGGTFSGVPDVPVPAYYRR